MSAKEDGRVRVLYVIDKMGAGGAQTHLATLVLGLDRSRFDPSVVCLMRGGVSADRLRAAGVSVEVFGVRRLYGPAGLAAFVRLVRLLRRRRPDILHTYLTSANVFGTMAALAAGVRGVITSRRDDGHGDGLLMRRALAATNLCARRVVSVSRHAALAAREREGLDESRVAVIGNGIDLARFRARGRREETRVVLGLGAGTPVLLMVGHLTRVKGVDVLIEAMAEVRRALPAAVCLVAGDGDAEAFQALVAARGLGAAVRLLGRRLDVPDLLEAADVFVLPSRTEGQPNALIEAMAVGTAAVATRVGGVPEVARDGAEALLVPSEDPRALARACIALLTDRERARRLGQAAAARAREEFGVEAMARRFEEVYLEVRAGCPDARALVAGAPASGGGQAA